MSTVFFWDLPPALRGTLRSQLAVLGPAERCRGSVYPPPPVLANSWEKAGLNQHSASRGEPSQAPEEAGSKVKLPGVEVPV